MKIASLSVKIPSLKITNEQILEYVAQYNQDQPAEVVAHYQRELSYLLHKSGAQIRYFRDQQNGETAIDLVQAAAAEALIKAELSSEDIDLLIYCGVGKGFLEPANAYFCAEALEMTCCCFDVSDACMSWVRSLEIAQSMMSGGTYRNVLIINGEFTVYEYGFPDAFRIVNRRQLDYTFPAYTIGEAATATIVNYSEQHWKFSYRSLPSLANLCTIPLVGYDAFCRSTNKIGLTGINQFASFGREMFEAALANIADLVQENVTDINALDLWFPHGASIDQCRRLADFLALDPAKVYTDSFSSLGNLVSASIPAAMHKAETEGRLRRGMRVALTPGSAGMSFGFTEFVY